VKITTRWAPAVVVCRPERRVELVALARVAGFEVVGAGLPWPEVSRLPAVVIVEDGIDLPGRSPWPHIRSHLVVPPGVLDAITFVVRALAPDPELSSSTGAGERSATEQEPPTWRWELADRARTVDATDPAGTGMREMYRLLVDISGEVQTHTLPET